MFTTTENVDIFLPIQQPIKSLQPLLLTPYPQGMNTLARLSISIPATPSITVSLSPPRMLGSRLSGLRSPTMPLHSLTHRDSRAESWTERALIHKSRPRH